MKSLVCLRTQVEPDNDDLISTAQSILEDYLNLHAGQDDFGCVVGVITADNRKISHDRDFFQEDWNALLPLTFDQVLAKEGQDVIERMYHSIRDCVPNRTVLGDTELDLRDLLKHLATHLQEQLAQNTAPADLRETIEQITVANDTLITLHSADPFTDPDSPWNGNYYTWENIPDNEDTPRMEALIYLACHW